MIQTARCWLFVLLILSKPILAQSDPNVVPEIAQTCVACHNEDGNSTVSIWPKIAGQPIRYLQKMLKAYRAGASGPLNEPTMAAVVAELSDQDLADLAFYYASQTMSEGKTKPEAIPLGQRLYRGGDPQKGVAACMACHTPKGTGLGLAAIPRLSGQHPDYIRQQLERYRAGIRKTDQNGIMRDIAKRLTDEEIEAISQYVSGLH